MSFSRSVLALLAALWCGAAQADAGLSYRAVFRSEAGAAAQEVRFRLKVANPKPRRGRIPKPRWGTWRLEALQVPAELSVPLVLARLERLLYLAPPTEGSHPEGHSTAIGRRRLPVWSLLGGASAELVELRKGLLALFHLKGDFPGQGMHDLDLRLERIEHDSRIAPPQEGEALLATLRGQMAPAPLSPLGPEVVR